MRDRHDERVYRHLGIGRRLACWLVGGVLGLGLTVWLGANARERGWLEPRWLQDTCAWLWCPLAAVCELLVPGRRGYRLGPDGLTERRAPWRERHYPWSAIRSVEVTLRGARIDVGSVTIRLDEQTSGWRELAARIRDRLEPAPPADAEPVPRETIREWLHIPPGGVLVCRSPRWLVPIVWAVALGCLAGLCVGGGLAGWLAGGLAAAVAGRWLWRAQPVIRADETGFTWRRGRELLNQSWGDILRLDGAARPDWRIYWTGRAATADVLWSANCRGGLVSFYHSDCDGAILAAAMQQCVAAREAGGVLPAGMVAGPSALSRPRMSGEAAAERGISPVSDSVGPHR